MRTWAYERKFVMPARPFPSKPDLTHLKYQAKDLLRAHAAGDIGAAQRLREFHPRFRKASDAEIFAAHLKLSDAQLAIGREYGFPSWARLKHYVEKPGEASQLNRKHHERITDPVFRRAVELIDAGDAAGLREHLQRHPGLSRQHVAFEGGNYFHHPSLLEFVAENPVRHGRLPDNIVEVAQVIVDAGVEASSLNETLGLVATGRVPREFGVQIGLIDFLCDHGADPNSAARAAAAHGEREAVYALLRRGAPLDLPVAAALNHLEDCRRLLPAASPEERHLALAMAAQFGHVEVARLLLDAGEDPNRYNPPGSHSHSTPLHQAALAGCEPLVQLLLERGARPDMKDILWQGTPAGWAEYNGHNQLAEWLREKEQAKAACTPVNTTL
jgi:hypothetical protein